MNKLKTLLILLLTAVALGASAHAKKFKAPALYGMKALPAGTNTTLRDSIVSRNADGSLNFKTTYTYDEHGYLTSKLTRRADGTYDTTDQNFFVDYAFDAQGHCTLRSVSRCLPNGQRGQETERTEAYYNYNGYTYYEIRFEWDDGRRYAAEEIGYDQWMNPVYGIGREYSADELVISYLAHQQFTGRAYAVKEGDLELLLYHRLVFSVIYDREGSWSDQYRVEGERREQVAAGDSVVTTYYELDDIYLALDEDPTPYWTKNYELVWKLNAAHTRPFSMRYVDYEYYGIPQKPKKEYSTRDIPDQSVGFEWDDKDRLTKVINYHSNWEGNFEVEATTTFTYADDQANSVPLSRLLDVEDSDSWPYGGMEDYEGDFIFNGFGRMAKIERISEDYYDNYTTTVDAWDEAGRIAHWTDFEGDYEDEAWMTYREDGKIAEIIYKECESFVYYEKGVVHYDRWGIITNVVWYRSESFDGPWEDTNNSYYKPPRKRIWDQRTYEEGNWEVWEWVETDDNDTSIIVWGQKAKYWRGWPFEFQLDTYRDPRGPLEYTYDWDDVVERIIAEVQYSWDVSSGEWVMDKHWGDEVWASRTLDDGRIANDYYQWDNEAGDMVYVSSEYYTLDDQRRVVVHEGFDGTDRFAWFADTTWPQQLNWHNGQVDTYYYSQRNYVDPDLLSIDDHKSTTAAPDAWYSLQGQRLQSRPTQPGVYIHGGRKTVVR